MDAQYQPLTEILRRHLDDTCIWEGKKIPIKLAIIRRVADLAVKGDRWAIGFIFDRIEGKALERVNIGGNLPNTLAEFIQCGLDSRQGNRPISNSAVVDIDLVKDSDDRLGEGL
jgi:hypothetical protein